MAAVTICSDFGAQENKVCHCFHCFPLYLPWSDGTMILVSGWIIELKNKTREVSMNQMRRALISHGLKHSRLSCPSPSPGVCSNSCPFSWWCHPIISSSVVPFSSCLQSFPASGSFPKSQFFASSGFSFSNSHSSEYSGLISFRMDWLDLLAVQGLSRVFSNTTVQKHQFFVAQLCSQSNSHIHTWPLEKP